MLTRNDVFQLLESFSIRRDDIVTMHSSLREIGPIEGGADGLIDALKDYLCDGLLLIPTHTWANVNAANPHFDVRSTVPCIGTLAKVAAFRKDAVRTLHPTHSLAIFGKGAWEYAQGEEKSGTPAPMGGCLSRLYEREGKILLLETSECDMSETVLSWFLRNLAAQGILQVLRGIIVGKPAFRDKLETYPEVFRQVVGFEAGRKDLPILFNVNVGHAYPIGLFPLGLTYEIDCDNKTLRLLEPATI